ncbi:Pyridoxal kinase [Corynebacterium camporealensis]|uniref:pyridoxal kinase n=1 Tax=Corynebacterium camporealensis TaxID=161896 RepID=UPI000CFA3887|nr:pyridoxal kinase [Corynebacterium camporealensis]AVH88781.1 Pyridoxal kinase [Corynebacterium camporealensis]
MAVLSIQSHVTYGHVGNSAAVFPLQRAGLEVWPVNTVNFSNHTECPDWGGPAFPASTVRDIIDATFARQPDIDAVLTGYLGTPELADVVIDTVSRVKDSSDALFACDPVIGNAIYGSFVADDIPGVFRDELIPLADVITPNQWEVALLSGMPCTDLESTIAAARSLCSTVLVTSVDTGDANIGMLAVDPDNAYFLTTPRVPGQQVAGGKVVAPGPLTTSLFTSHLLRGASLPDALEATASAVFDVIYASHAAGSDELQLVQNQDVFVHPRRQFRAYPC